LGTILYSGLYYNILCYAWRVVAYVWNNFIFERLPFQEECEKLSQLESKHRFLLFSCLLAVRCVWHCSDLQTSVTQPRTFATRRSVCDFLCWWFTTCCCCERL